MHIIHKKTPKLSIDFNDFKHLPINAFYKDIEGRYVWCNDHQIEDVEQHPKEIYGQNDIDLQGKTAAKLIVCNDQHVITNAQILTVPEKRSDDMNQLYLSTKLPCFSNDGELTGIFGYSFTISSNDPNWASNQQTSHYFNAIQLTTTLTKQHNSVTPLTKREKQVLTQTALGLTAAQTADKLFISKRTVEGHLENIKNKTGCLKKSELIKFALKTGLISLYDIHTD